MAVTLNVDADFDIFDNQADVTVTFKRSSGNTIINDVGALRRGFDKPVAFFAGIAIRGDEVIYNLKASELSGNEPISGDTITTAGAVVYAILGTQLFSFNSRWRCICREERT